MKAVRITELDEITEFPVGYIVKADGSDEMVGLDNCSGGSHPIAWLGSTLES
jgi:hypothetical protein